MMNENKSINSELLADKAKTDTNEQDGFDFIMQIIDSFYAHRRLFVACGGTINKP